MANLPGVTVTTGLSCRRQTRATRCVKPILLLDASVIEQLVTDDHHTERPPMLTTLAAVSVQLRKKKLQVQSVDKIPERSTVILEISEIPPNRT